MAIKRIPVPFCDVCKEPWLPKHRLADGTVNPVFTDPSLGKRCGKCKRTGWNAGGVDRRRKQVVESPVEAEASVPEVTFKDVVQAMPMPVIDPEVFAYGVRLTQDAQLVSGVATSSRCRHGLYKCPQCHSEKAA